VAGAPPIVARFREVYPAGPGPGVFRAPGRVNLIGEHTDYNLGFVLPMAIGLECQIAIAPAGDDLLRVYSDQLHQAAHWRVKDIPSAKPRGDWSDRVAAVAWELCRRGVSIKPANILISSTVPLGGGLSSSAALGVSLALALGRPCNRVELAQIARTAETDFVGIPCGIMDQFASASGGAILLDCRTLDSRPVELPGGLIVVAINSMVKHQLGDSAYPTRVAECNAAARALGVASLRDASVDQLSQLDGVLLKRARHVITENARTRSFASATAEEMGRLVFQSHASLRDDYEVSCPEIDFLVDTAMAVPGVLGARLTGGGFGGSTVNLVRREALQNLTSTVIERYRSVWNLTPQIHICSPAAGASQIF